MTNLLLGIPIEGHLYVERIPLEEIPEDPEGAAQWLKDLYYKKVSKATSQPTSEIFNQRKLFQVHSVISDLYYKNFIVISLKDEKKMY